jgi:hypothetical protein
MVREYSVINTKNYKKAVKEENITDNRCRLCKAANGAKHYRGIIQP